MNALFTFETAPKKPVPSCELFLYKLGEHGGDDKSHAQP